MYTRSFPLTVLPLPIGETGARGALGGMFPYSDRLAAGRSNYNLFLAARDGGTGAVGLLSPCSLGFERVGSIGPWGYIYSLGGSIFLLLPNLRQQSGVLGWMCHQFKRNKQTVTSWPLWDLWRFFFFPFFFSGKGESFFLYRFPCLLR